MEDGQLANQQMLVKAPLVSVPNKRLVPFLQGTVQHWITMADWWGAGSAGPLQCSSAVRDQQPRGRCEHWAPVKQCYQTTGKKGQPDKQGREAAQEGKEKRVRRYRGWEEENSGMGSGWVPQVMGKFRSATHVHTHMYTARDYGPKMFTHTAHHTHTVTQTYTRETHTPSTYTHKHTSTPHTHANT